MGVQSGQRGQRGATRPRTPQRAAPPQRPPWDDSVAGQRSRVAEVRPGSGLVQYARPTLTTKPHVLVLRRTQSPEATPGLLDLTPRTSPEHLGSSRLRARASLTSPRDPLESLEEYVDRVMVDVGDAHRKRDAAPPPPRVSTSQLDAGKLELRWPTAKLERTLSYSRLHANIDALVDGILDLVLRDTVDALEQAEAAAPGPPPAFFAFKDATTEMEHVERTEQLLRDKYSDVERVPAEARAQTLSYAADPEPPARAAPQRRRVPMPMRDVMALDQARARFREDQLLREADLAGHQFASWVVFDSLAEQICADMLADVLSVGDLAEALDSLVQDLIAKEISLPQ